MLPADAGNEQQQQQLVIIFLDIDGVLLPFPKAEASIPPDRLFPTRTVDALALIFQHIPTAQLVLSSTWRVQESFRNDILREFEAHNAAAAATTACTGKLPSAFYDVTDVDMHTERQHEIYHWLHQQQEQEKSCFDVDNRGRRRRRRPVSAWVALDDEELLEGLANQRYQSHFADHHVVKCDSRTGLTMEQAHRAVRMLQQQLKAS